MVIATTASASADGTRKNEQALPSDGVWLRRAMDMPELEDEEARREIARARRQTDQSIAAAHEAADGEAAAATIARHEASFALRARQIRGAAIVRAYYAGQVRLMHAALGTALREITRKMVSLNAWADDGGNIRDSFGGFINVKVLPLPPPPVPRPAFVPPIAAVSFDEARQLVHDAGLAFWAFHESGAVTISGWRRGTKTTAREVIPFAWCGERGRFIKSVIGDRTLLFKDGAVFDQVEVIWHPPSTDQEAATEGAPSLPAALAASPPQIPHASANDGTPPRKAKRTPAKAGIRAEARKVYGDWQAAGRKPPNINEAATELGKRIGAPRELSRQVLAEPEFADVRLPAGARAAKSKA